MSSGEIQRLEGLLARVQHNRQAARHTTSVVEDAKTSPLERALESRVATPVGTPAPTPMAAPQPRAVSRPAPAPVAAPIAKPVVQPVAQAKAPAPMATAPVIAARPAPVATPPLDPNVPVRIATSVASASTSFASAVSPHPTMDAPSFRELLRRTLSLRPR